MLRTLLKHNGPLKGAGLALALIASVTLACNRKIARSVRESSRDIARALANTDAYRKSRKDRKKVEMLFAHLKRISKLDRLRLRGRSGAQDEFLLALPIWNSRPHNRKSGAYNPHPLAPKAEKQTPAY